MLAEVLSPSRSVDMRRVLATMSRQMGIEFVVAGTPEPAISVFSNEALMPVVGLHAQVKAKETLGINLGIELEKDDQALLGVYCRLPMVGPDSMGVLRACFLTQAAHRIFGMEPNVQIEVAPVIERYINGLAGGEHLEKSGWPVALVSPR